jgi:hypothetical protein
MGTPARIHPAGGLTHLSLSEGVIIASSDLIKIPILLEAYSSEP